MRDRYLPFDTRSSAFLLSTFCFPTSSLGQPARTISNPESGCITYSARTHWRLAPTILPTTDH
jgi:hypothetical protein